MPNEAKQRLTVWWILWAAFQIGIFVIYHFLSRTSAQPQPPSAASATWLAGFAPFFVSTIIRWGVLPRVARAQAAFPLFIIGIAMAEASCFLGLFIFPAHQQELFMLSVLGIFQFVPCFARRYFTLHGHHAPNQSEKP